MSQQDMDLPAEPRVAWDSDGEAWEEIIAENGEPTGVFKARMPDGDELTLGQLDQQYGLDSVDAGDRDLLLWLHAEAVWRGQRMREAGDRMAAALVERQREVKRLRREVEFEALGGVGIDGGARARDNLRYPLCACLNAEQKTQLRSANESNPDGPQWSLPLCAVHPEAK